MKYPLITLEAARVNAHFTQKDAARKLGICKETLSSYEKGKTYPTMDMAQKMAELYCFPIDFIYFY